METASSNVALSFAKALVGGNFEAAQRMLTSSLQGATTPEDLKSEYELMTSYWSAPANEVSVAGEPESPGQEDDEAGWVYVSISSPRLEGGVNLEAIFARVVTTSEGDRIARIVWGRP